MMNLIQNKKDIPTPLIFFIGVIGFVLNLIWENAQAPLYVEYAGFRDHFLMCLDATVIDVMIILSLYAVITFVKNNWYWVTNIEKRVITLVCILGLFVALIIEQRALHFEVWTYTNQMPVLPFFSVGLLPVLQMLVVPILTYWISGVVYKKRKHE